jgi:type I restriction-modification system DNA methylase subunit
MSDDDKRGTYYFVPKRVEPVELLANPPYATGTKYVPACGTGAFLVEAAKQLDAGATVRAG